MRADATLRELHRSGQFPEQAGLAKLRIRCSNGSPGHQVRRSGNQIHIHTGWDAKFHFLNHGQQFLLRGHFNRGPVSFCDFGGTDENPFVTIIDREAYHTFLESGEEAFYASLKPPNLKVMEKEFGVSSLRQGDIWAIKIPMDWKDVVRASLLNFGYRPMRDSGERHRVFNTRHELIGDYAPYGKWNRAIAQGILQQRPEHTDLDLSGGLYLLERTPFLKDGGD